jgi:hypothetical protein
MPRRRLHGVTYQLFFVTEDFPLLANQLRTLRKRDVFEITAGLAADIELHECVAGLLDVAFILDGRPLLRAFRTQAAAQLGASQVRDSDFVDVVRLHPGLVFCVFGLTSCVGQVVVVLFLLAVETADLGVRPNTYLEFSRSHILPGCRGFSAVIGHLSSDRGHGRLAL